MGALINIGLNSSSYLLDRLSNTELARAVDGREHGEFTL